MKNIYLSFVLFFLFTYTINAQTDAFITRWKVENNDNLNLKIKVSKDYSYNYDIDWGDNSSNTGVTKDITHTYSKAGEYSTTITGTFPKIEFGNMRQIVDVLQWGTMEWQSMKSAFERCRNLTKFSATDVPDLNKVTDMSRIFLGSALFNGDISNWDVSKKQNYLIRISVTGM